MLANKIKKHKITIGLLLLLMVVIIVGENWNRIDYFIYKIGFGNKPIFGSITIEMKEGWYPYISS